MSPIATAASLKDFAPDAVSLFNNMKTPASIIAGGLVPLGFAAPVAAKSDKKETRLQKALRVSYSMIALLSFLSQLVSVMYATVAVNQLTETSVAPAESVW